MGDLIRRASLRAELDRRVDRMAGRGDYLATYAECIDLIDNAPSAAPSPALTREALAAALCADDDATPFGHGPNPTLEDIRAEHPSCQRHRMKAERILAALSKIPPPTEEERA